MQLLTMNMQLAIISDGLWDNKYVVFEDGCRFKRRRVRKWRRRVLYQTMKYVGLGNDRLYMGVNGCDLPMTGLGQALSGLDCTTTGF